MILIPDTHTLLWFLADDPKLGRSAKEALLRRENIEIVIPIIVLFEISHLQKKRGLSISLADIHHWITGNAHVRVHPIDIAVLDATPEGLEIHDAMIAGTAVVLSRSSPGDVVVATCDQMLARCKAVKVIW